MLDAYRLAVVRERRPFQIDRVQSAEIAADRAGLQEREPSAVGDLSRERFEIFLIRDRLAQLERTAGTSGVGDRLVEFSGVDRLVDRRAGDVTRRSERAFGNVPFE